MMFTIIFLLFLLEIFYY